MAPAESRFLAACWVRTTLAASAGELGCALGA